MNGNCGHKEGWAGERYSTMTWNMEWKSSFSFFNQLEPAVFGDGCREEGRTQTYMVCRLTSASAPPCSLLLLSSGPAVRPASEEPSAAALKVWSQVFMRCEENRFSPQPSAAFPEAEEFSLNPKEKYLYMRFYDLKSVHETDLYPHFPEESSSKGVASKYPAAWLVSIHAKRWMKHCSWFWSQTQPSEKRLALSLQFSSFTCIIHVTPTNYLGLAPSKCQNCGFIGQCFLCLASCYKYTVI